jgi:hypothetical protein
MLDAGALDAVKAAICARLGIQFTLPLPRWSSVIVIGVGRSFRRTPPRQSRPRSEKRPERLKAA